MTEENLQERTDRKPIIAVDFDGTLRRAGKANDVLFNVIKVREDDIDFVLWTSREDEDLEEAIIFCIENGWSPKYVNENVDKTKKDCRKIFADVYIDDLMVRQDDYEFFRSLVTDIGSSIIKQ